MVKESPYLNGEGSRMLCWHSCDLCEMFEESIPERCPNFTFLDCYNASGVEWVDPDALTTPTPAGRCVVGEPHHDAGGKQPDQRRIGVVSSAGSPN